MKKICIILIILLAALSAAGKVSVTQLSDNSYRVLWEMPRWKLSVQEPYSRIVSGLGMPAEPGAPLLPFDECKVAVPVNGSISVNLISQSAEKIRLEKRIQPVPYVTGGGEADSYQYRIDETLYSSALPELLSVLPNQRFRTLSFVPIRINPFQYNGQYDLRVVSRLEFTVSINGDTTPKSFQPQDELTSLIAGQTINPAQSAYWQITERSRVNFADFSMSDFWVRIETDKDGMYKLTPSQLNMLPLSDIDPRTFRLFTTGGEVHSNQTNYPGPAFREVPVYVSGESDGNFDSADYIVFFGRDRDGLEMNQVISGVQFSNPYSKNVVYWLTFGGAFADNPRRIRLSTLQSDAQMTVTNTPETVRIEVETYQRTPVGFDWYMGKLFGTTSAEYNYAINLEDLDNTQTQTLSMRVVQEHQRLGSENIRKIRLKVNGVQLLNLNNTVQEWSWMGLSPITITHTGSYFSNGNNNIAINVIRNTVDNLYLDYYQVAYQKKLIKRDKQFFVSIPSGRANQRVRYNFTGQNNNIRVFKTNVSTSAYEVSEIQANVNLGGFDFIESGTTAEKYVIAQESDYYSPALIQGVTPVDLSVSSSSYDNIIITPPEFLSSADHLASFYQQHFGKSSKVVLLQDIFNQFNGGMPDPNAVRLFLKNSVQNYPSPAITSVTLLGSGTIDWRNFSGVSALKNKMIVFQKFTSSSDDFFGMLNTEQYPELAIGRYPAKTQNDMSIMLANLENYVTNPTPGIWRNSLLLVADDEYNGPHTGEYSHSEQLQETSEFINKSILIDKIFAIDYEFDEFQNKPQARDDMMAAINDGTLVWYYIGHGSFDTLGAEDYFKGSLDMGRFENQGRLPLFIAASCNVGQFDSFAFDSLAEKVVLVNNSACIASIAGTRETSGPSNVALMKQYFRYSLNLRNPIGYSLLSAKVVFTQFNSNDEKYNILGDPLLLITTPQRDSTITITTSARDNILNSREQVSLQGRFPSPGIDNTASLYVYDTEIPKTMANNAPYTLRGKTVFRGQTNVANSQYSAGFIVPDDVSTGNSGLILSYLWDPLQKKDYISYSAPIAFSEQAAAVDNPDAPQIELFLDSVDFSEGDTVSQNPLLMAKISDQNGINITNSPGRSILLILNRTESITNVTDNFVYNKDSFTHGTLNYQLSNLREGNHMLQLIAFDNFNRPSVASTNFTVEKTRSFTVENFLPYPNPMQKNGWFTFTVSDAADVKISIYTIRGRRIKTINHTAVKGYNQIAWDGRDQDGDYLANNTYFIKLTAKSLSGNNKAEKTERLVIFH